MFGPYSHYYNGMMVGMPHQNPVPPTAHHPNPHQLSGHQPSHSWNQNQGFLNPEWLSHAHHAAGSTPMHHPASMASNQTNPQNYQNLPLPHAAHWTDLNIKLESNEENQNSAKNSIMSSSSSNDSTSSSIEPSHDGYHNTSGKNFDPTTRMFSRDELRPQPIIKKKRKQFVPDYMKDNKYWVKRKKNNESAKMSREAQRIKANQIVMRAAFLEDENGKLQKEVDETVNMNTIIRNDVTFLSKRLSQYQCNRQPQATAIM